MRRLLTLAAVATAAFAASGSVAAADASPRCVGNGALDLKYCVDTEGSCLLASYAKPPTGSRCWVRNP